MTGSEVTYTMCIGWGVHSPVTVQKSECHHGSVIRAAASTRVVYLLRSTSGCKFPSQVAQFFCSHLMNCWNLWKLRASNCQPGHRSEYTGWPKRVSHYQDPSLNRTKNCPCVYILINFEYKMSSGILRVYIKYSMCDLICDVISCCV